jgi:hypothetical protein
VRPLSPHEFNQRRDHLFSRLDRLGRVDLRDLGANKRVRKIVADLLIPRQGREFLLPDEVHFRYQEWWRPSAFGWLRVRYNYDYFDLVNGGRRGYHLHPLKGPEPVPHAVCVLCDGSGEDRHFVAYEMDLLAVHEEFEGQYAAGRPVDCRGLRPID